MDGDHRAVRVDAAHSATNTGMPEGAVYWQIWRTTQSPDYHPDQVVSLITQNSQIADRLLRVANSPAMGVRREITSVRQAVLMIGLRGVAEFARPRAARYEATSEGRTIRTDSAETNTGPLGRA